MWTQQKWIYPDPSRQALNCQGGNQNTFRCSECYIGFVMRSKCWQFHQIDYNVNVSPDMWIDGWTGLFQLSTGYSKMTLIELHVSSHPMPGNIEFGVIMPEVQS